MLCMKYTVFLLRFLHICSLVGGDNYDQHCINLCTFTLRILWVLAATFASLVQICLQAIQIFQKQAIATISFICTAQLPFA